MIGSTISHYRILEKLGEGGMGVVYKAEDTKLKRVVALKVLLSRLLSDEESKVRFIHEAQAAANLIHPNIATIFEFDEVEGVAFITIEYIEGTTLRQKIDAGPLAIDEALQIARATAEGLAKAHSMGIVHRDIKPENIMLSRDGRVKVMDFGLATIVGRTIITKIGSTVGTIAYMSPEQARGESTDRRTDLWSLGAVLYEMVTGQRPFQSEYEQAIIYQILNEEPEKLTTLRPDAPENVGRIVHKALTKNPQERYQSAEEIIADLDAVLGHEQKRPLSILARLLPVKSRKMRVGIGAAVAGLIVALLVGLFILLKPEFIESPADASTQAIAVLPFSVRGSPEFTYLGEGMVNLLSTKLDGAGELRSVDPRALLSFVAREVGSVVDPDDGLKVAKHFRAGFYVMGDIIEVGGTLQINATLYDGRKGAVEVGRGTSGGEVVKLFDVVDDVATQLLIRISGERGQPSARVKQLAAVTTSSLSALKAYLEGESALRAGRYEEALAAFQRAVSEDTAFALGYYRLSIAAEWNLRATLAHEMAQYAFRHAARLSERDHRLFEALLAYRQGDALKAEELYRTIVGIYPDDVEAWMQFGEVLFHYIPLHARSMSESQEAFKKVLFYEPDHAGALEHLARLAAREGNLSELDSLVQRYHTLSPHGDRALPMRALQVFTHGTEKTEREILSRLEHVSDATVGLAAWEVAVYRGNVQGAERICRLLTHSSRSAEVRAIGHIWLAHIAIAHGQWNRAKEELSSIEPLDRAAFLEYRALLSFLPFLPVHKGELLSLRKALTVLNPARVPTSNNPTFFFSPHNGLHAILQTYLLGILAARSDEINDALQYAKQVETLPGPSGAGSLPADFGLSIRAQVEVSRGRDGEALAILDRTRRATWYQLAVGSPFYSQAYERFLRAELLFKMGNHHEALRWYRTIVSTSVFEAAYLSLSYYRMGQIFERIGDIRAAIAHYGKFIELWKECDVELRPMVVDAQQRMQKLTE